MARRKRYLFVCVNRRPDGTPKGSCAARGAVEFHAELKKRLKQRGLADLEIRPCTASCLDVCWVGPALVVMPQNDFYGRLSIDDIDELIDALARDQQVPRLMLKPEDFTAPKSLSNPPTSANEEEPQ